MPLVAELTIEPEAAKAPEAFTATCTLANAGELAVEVNLAALSSPSLALEIRTVAGQAVSLPPPPVPPTEPPMARLEAGGRRVERFGGFLPSWTEPGEYAARCRYVSGSTAVYSAWVRFTLTG